MAVVGMHICVSLVVNVSASQCMYRHDMMCMVHISEGVHTLLAIVHCISHT